MYLKRFKIIVIITLIISIILGTIIVIPKNNTSLQLVTYSVLANDNSTYLVEQKDTTFKIYHIDDNNKVLEYIEYPKITKDYYYWLLNPKCFGKDVYILMYQNKTASTDGTKYNLYKCNFKKHSLQKVTNLENNINDIIDYQIDGDKINLRYVYYDYQNYDYFLKSNSIINKFNKNDIQNISDIDAGITYKNIILDKYGNTYFLDTNLELYKVTNYNEYIKLYPSKDSAKITQISYDGNNSIYFIDSTSNELICYNIQKDTYKYITKDIEKSFKTYNLEHSTDYSISNLRNISFDSNGNFTASIDGFNDNYILCKYIDNKITIVDTINNNLGVVKNILFILGCSIIIFIIISAIMFVIYTLHNRYIPLIIRITLTSVSLIAIAIVIIFNGMKFYLNDAFEKSNNDKILYVCENKLNSLHKISNDDVNTILNTDFNTSEYQDWTDIQNSIYSIVEGGFLTIDDIKKYSNGNLIDADINNNDDYLYSIYILNKSNNRLYLAYNSSYWTCIPFDYIKSQYIYNIAEEVIKSGEKIITDDLFLMQKSTAIYAPIVSIEGDTIGLLEVNAVNHLETSFKVSEIINKIILEIIIIVFILLSIILVLLFIFLNPLKELKDKAILLSKKNIGITVKPIGNNEISALAMQFNKMSLELAENISHIRCLNEHYEYYIPTQICKIFKSNNISSIKLGDSNSVSLAILHLNLSLNDMDIEEHSFVERLNHLLEKIVSIVESNNGFIQYINRHEVVIFYLEKYVNCIRTAVSINEYINQMNNTNPEDCITAKMLASYNSCTFKVIGNSDRMTFAIDIQEDIKIHTIESIYNNCNLIVTNDLISKLNNFFEVFDNRFIGIFSSDTKVSKLYEVFNGDNLYNKNLKRIYKDKFEKAINLYLLKEYRSARNIFAEILENYPEDDLSKNYIYLCDNIIKQGGETI